MTHSKEVFKKMKEEYPRRDMGFVEKVFSTFEEVEENKKQVTITQVATNLKAKREKIKRAFDLLIDCKLIKKAGASFGIPFFKATNIKGEATKFIFGKENRENYLDKYLNKVRPTLQEEEYQIFQQKRKESTYRFLKECWNPFVEKNWKDNQDSKLEKIELNSKAVRYQSK